MTRSRFCLIMAEIFWQYSRGIITATEKTRRIKEANLALTDGVEQVDLFNGV